MSVPSLPETIRVIPRADPVLAHLGYPVRSDYAELYWLPVIGPASLLVSRHLVARFTFDADGYDATTGEVARAVGLNVPMLARTFARLERYGLVRACWVRGSCEVATHVAPLPARHARHLPEALRTVSR